MTVTGGFKLVREGKPRQSFFSCFSLPSFAVSMSMSLGCAHTLAILSPGTWPSDAWLQATSLLLRCAARTRREGDSSTGYKCDTKVNMAPRSFRLQVRNNMSVSLPPHPAASHVDVTRVCVRVESVYYARAGADPAWPIACLEQASHARHGDGDGECRGVVGDVPPLVREVVGGQGGGSTEQIDSTARKTVSFPSRHRLIWKPEFRKPSRWLSRFPDLSCHVGRISRQRL